MNYQFWRFRGEGSCNENIWKGQKVLEYGSDLRFQSEYKKIRTGNNSVFGHFSRTLRSEAIFDNWKPFKNDEKCFFISPWKLFSFSIYLSFCYDFLIM